METGKINTMRVLREVEFGVFLDGAEYGEILLPKRYVPADCHPQQKLDVFVYTDSEDRLVAVTETPTIQVGQFAALEVKQLTSVGAFLAWCSGKDLLLPFSEQKKEVQEGEKVFVYAYLDRKTGRVVATAKWEKFLTASATDFTVGQEVCLQLAGQTDLGYKAIIDGKAQGLLYKGEVFRPLPVGSCMKGYVRRLREDGKIDVSLHPSGYAKVQDETQVLLQKLKEVGGYLPLTDKSPAELIYTMLGMSKRTYKQAVGALYKRHILHIEPEGIRLT